MRQNPAPGAPLLPPSFIPNPKVIRGERPGVGAFGFHEQHLRAILPHEDLSLLWWIWLSLRALCDSKDHPAQELLNLSIRKPVLPWSGLHDVGQPFFPLPCSLCIRRPLPLVTPDEIDPAQSLTVHSSVNSGFLAQRLIQRSKAAPDVRFDRWRGIKRKAIDYGPVFFQHQHRKPIRLQRMFTGWRASALAHTRPNPLDRSRSACIASC